MLYVFSRDSIIIDSIYSSPNRKVIRFCFDFLLCVCLCLNTNNYFVFANVHKTRIFNRTYIHSARRVRGELF